MLCCLKIKHFCCLFGFIHEWNPLLTLRISQDFTLMSSLLSLFVFILLLYSSRFPPKYNPNPFTTAAVFFPFIPPILSCVFRMVEVCLGDKINIKVTAVSRGLRNLKFSAILCHFFVITNTKRVRIIYSNINYTIF